MLPNARDATIFKFAIAMGTWSLGPCVVMHCHVHESMYCLSIYFRESNTQKKSLPCSRFDLEANSDKLIFEKVVFVGNRVITPTHERVVFFQNLLISLLIGL